MAGPALPERKVEVGNRTIADGSAFIIAEMACAHDGDIGKARELIAVAHNAQVDAVQLQIFHSPANVVDHHRLKSVLEKIEFSANQWEDLVAQCRKLALPVFACAYDFPSLELALKLGVDGVKFNSADLGNREMLELAAGSGVFFTLGTGASRLDEVGKALSVVLDHGGSRVVLMHGIQAFPTRIDKADIRRIGVLKQAFGALVGYADHTDGDDPFAGVVDLLALGAGACVLEKHFTLNRAEKGLDYQAALNPDQLATYVSGVRTGLRALGSGSPLPFDEDDKRYRQFQKKRIVAARPMPSGTVISRADVALLRTDDGEGMDAASLDAVLGKQLCRSLNRHALVLAEDLVKN
ncbi:MAG TPA: N-acetylneuraminate synthase family protein [Burkholderiales bacterium]|nr:N-acetylneuraminate synthase family protein [Burkholderiales bacterium]